MERPQFTLGRLFVSVTLFALALLVFRIGVNLGRGGRGAYWVIVAAVLGNFAIARLFIPRGVRYPFWFLLIQSMLNGLGVGLAMFLFGRLTEP